MASPTTGNAAPDFTVPATGPNPLVLSDLLKEGPVVLAFFPRAFTGG